MHALKHLLVSRLVYTDHWLYCRINLGFLIPVIICTGYTVTGSQLQHVFIVRMHWCLGALKLVIPSMVQTVICA